MLHRLLLFILAASRRARAIYTQLDHVNTHHRHVEAKLRRLRSDVHLSGIAGTPEAMLARATG